MSKSLLSRVHALIDDLAVTGDDSAMKAAEQVLRVLLRSAVQAKHNRAFPEYTRDAVEAFVRKAKKGKKS